MKFTITFKENDYCSAHKFAMLIKSLTGQRYEEIEIGADRKIIFSNIYFSNRVIEGIKDAFKNGNVL